MKLKGLLFFLTWIAALGLMGLLVRLMRPPQEPGRRLQYALGVVLFGLGVVGFGLAFVAFGLTDAMANEHPWLGPTGFAAFLLWFPLSVIGLVLVWANRRRHEPPQ